MQTPARAHRASKRARASVRLLAPPPPALPGCPTQRTQEIGEPGDRKGAAGDRGFQSLRRGGRRTLVPAGRQRARHHRLLAPLAEKGEDLLDGGDGRDARPGRRNQHRKRGPPVQLPRGTVRKPLVGAEDEPHVDGGAGRDGETPAYSFSVANGAELLERRNDQYPRGALPPSDQPAGLGGASRAQATGSGAAPGSRPHAIPPHRGSAPPRRAPPSPPPDRDPPP